MCNYFIFLIFIKILFRKHPFLSSERIGDLQNQEKMKFLSLVILKVCKNMLILKNFADKFKNVDFIEDFMKHFKGKMQERIFSVLSDPLQSLQVFLQLIYPFI